MVPSCRHSIPVENRAPHDVLFALATMFDKARSDPFWAFTDPPDTSREITSSSHAFQTTGVTPGSKPNFADPDFLVRITE